MTLFNISVGQFLFLDSGEKEKSMRRQLDATLDELYERDYIVMEATAKGLKKGIGGFNFLFLYLCSILETPLTCMVVAFFLCPGIVGISAVSVVVGSRKRNIAIIGSVATLPYIRPFRLQPEPSKIACWEVSQTLLNRKERVRMAHGKQERTHKNAEDYTRKSTVQPDNEKEIP